MSPAWSRSLASATSSPHRSHRGKAACHSLGYALIEMSRVIIQNSIRTSPGAPYSVNALAPGGVVLARSATAAMIRCKVAAPSTSPASECEFGSSSSALLERLITVALEHQLRGTPNVDLRYHSTRMYGRRR
jgi:hypothetical protein